MLYLLGIVCIILGMTGLGVNYVERERQRISVMEKWEYITELYLNEITYKKQPLSLASIEIGKKIGGEEGGALIEIGEKIKCGEEESFSNIWEKAWMERLKNTCLGREEKKLVLEFSGFTGYENEEMQQKMIMAQQEKWRHRRAKAQEESQEKNRIVLLLSLSAGILTVLMLL